MVVGQQGSGPPAGPPAPTPTGAVSIPPPDRRRRRPDDGGGGHDLAAAGHGEDHRADPPGTDPNLPQPVVDGRPVPGHPTHVVTRSGDQLALYVDRFVGGRSLVITVTSGLVPVEELYKIADGVRSVD